MADSTEGRPPTATVNDEGFDHANVRARRLRRRAGVQGNRTVIPSGPDDTDAPSPPDDPETGLRSQRRTDRPAADPTTGRPNGDRGTPRRPAQPVNRAAGFDH